MLSITTDNASSNTTFIAELAELTKHNVAPFEIENHIHCLAHVINLAVQDSMRTLQPLVRKVILFKKTKTKGPF